MSALAAAIAAGLVLYLALMVAVGRLLQRGAAPTKPTRRS